MKLLRQYQKYYPLNRVFFEEMRLRYRKAARKRRIVKKWTKRFGLLWKGYFVAMPTEQLLLKISEGK